MLIKHCILKSQTNDRNQNAVILLGFSSNFPKWTEPSHAFAQFIALRNSLICFGKLFLCLRSSLSSRFVHIWHSYTSVLAYPSPHICTVLAGLHSFTETSISSCHSLGLFSFAFAALPICILSTASSSIQWM